MSDKNIIKVYDPAAGEMKTGTANTKKEVLDKIESTQAELDNKLDKNSSILQTTRNAIGWEKNALFNATNRYTVVEKSSKAINVEQLFDGSLAPTNILNVSPENPYILEITGLPHTHTQGKAVFGWVSRYRVPHDFTVEIFNETEKIWQVIDTQSKYVDSYYYVEIPSVLVTGLRFTINKPNTGDYIQLAQVVFIHPELVNMYDGLLVHEKDLEDKIDILNKELDTVKQSGVKSNKRISDKLNSLKIEASDSDSVSENVTKFENIPNHGELTKTITTQYGKQIIAPGYYSGGEIKAIFNNMTSSNIKKGVNIGGVTGSYEGEPLKTTIFSGKYYEANAGYHTTRTHTMGTLYGQVKEAFIINRRSANTPITTITRNRFTQYDSPIKVEFIIGDTVVLLTEAYRYGSYNKREVVAMNIKPKTSDTSKYTVMIYFLDYDDYDDQSNYRLRSTEATVDKANNLVFKSRLTTLDSSSDVSVEYDIEFGYILA